MSLLTGKNTILPLVCLSYAPSHFGTFCFQILIGYESGQIVFWDLKTKSADYRCHSDEPLKSITWHHEGKQFMSSHSDGSLLTWTVRQLKPTNVTHPHGESQYPLSSILYGHHIILLSDMSGNTSHTTYNIFSFILPPFPYCIPFYILLRRYTRLETSEKFSLLFFSESHQRRRAGTL